MRRPERVADMLRGEVAQIVGYELDDPRVTMVTVTDVRVSDNLRNARVFVTVLGSEEEAAEALVALRHAAHYVRRQLGAALGLRHTPEIHFVRDTAEERGSRVDELLEQLGRDRQPTEEFSEVSVQDSSAPEISEKDGRKSVTE
ncbi:MAG: 30S ribosome-binding factor RbfA [Pyrinomonadaceae bacterium]